MIKVTPYELTVIADYINKLSGIYLDHSKAYLIEGRLGPLLDELHCSSYLELINKIKNTPTLGMTARLIDAISTNETSFFRDQKPFDLFQFKILPDHLDRIAAHTSPAENSIKIWSAACSTGQEVYSLAIAICELLRDSIHNYRISILGTDISEATIAKANQGIYTQIEMERGLPKRILYKYFTQEGRYWKICDQLRNMVYFKKRNLLEPLTDLGKFDVIFCRNVAIYFSIENRKMMFQQIIDRLYPNGALVIGSTESLHGIVDHYKRHEYHNAVFYTVN